MDSVSEGDKVYLFFKSDTELCRLKKFDGTYEKNRFFKKLYDSLCVLETLIVVDLFPNYASKRNKELLSA